MDIEFWERQEFLTQHLGDAQVMDLPGLVVSFPVKEVE